MKKFAIVVFAVIITISSYAQEYKEMMNDMSVNFYDVCNAAELYFSTIEKDAKGSGYKPYLRWKYANEYKFYPTGKRNNIDPYLGAKAYKAFLKDAGIINSTSSINGWLELGPLAIDSISLNYNAGLGRVEDIYVDPTDSNKMYMGSRSGGFWKTTDGGVTWQGGSTDTIMASGVNAIAVSPTNSDSILINVRNSKNGCSHGIYRSVNGGNTWDLSNFNPVNLILGGLGSNFKINKIAYHPIVPNLIFICTASGIYRSANNLQSWTQVLNFGNINDIEFHPTNPNIIYVYNNSSSGGVRDQVYRSTNMGLSFTLSNIISGNSNAQGHLSVSPVCDSCLFFASTNGVWKSTDNGINFSFIGNPSSGCADFEISDIDISKMIYGGINAYASTDGGANFNQVTWWSLGDTTHGGGSFDSNFKSTDLYVHADTRVLKCVNGVFYSGTDGFFCKSSDDGTSWQILSQGTAIRENYKLGTSQSNHYRTICGSQDNGLSIKHKDSWIEFFGGDGMEGIIHPLNDDWMIGSHQGGGRHRTQDGGQTINGGPPPNSNNGSWEAPIAYDPNNQMRVYDFRDSVYVSEDFGTTWSCKGKPNSFTNTIMQAAIAENNSDIIVISRYQHIEKSTDGGATFVSIKNNLPNHGITDIAFHPKNDNIIIVVYGNWQYDNSKIFITYNGGNSWTNITYNLGNMPLHTVVIDHTNSSNIYVGAEIGVYTKTLNANSWTLYNPNLPNTTVEELEIVYGSNTLKAATWGRGLWEFDLIGRSNYPSILVTKITDQPTDGTPLVNNDQYVTSVISYDNTLSSVFLKWSANNLSFSNSIPMANTMDSTWVSQTALPNYPIGTKMYFKVFAVGNNNDTSETYKFMYAVRPFEYCNGSGNINNSGLFINNVTISNINNTSVFDAYTYYNDSVVYLFVDSTYTISLSANNNWPNNKFGAWIDFNHNAIFDSIENFGMPSLVNKQSQTSFTVPSYANINDTLRLRIRLAYWGEVAEACGITSGEVEDYPVIVLDVPNLNYTISDSVLCAGSELIINYTGDNVDSLKWIFTDGTSSFIFTEFIDSIYIASAGNYNLSLIGYRRGFPFYLNSSNLLLVKDAYSTTLQNTTCNPNNAGTTVQTFTNAIGCDSVITTITNLLPHDSIIINLTSCNPNNVGTVVQQLTNIFGCDSTVIRNTSLLPSDSTFVSLTTCDPNNAGASVLHLTNVYGCDSVASIYTSLLPSDNVIVNLTTCNPNNIGTVIQQLSNVHGCDSIVTTKTVLDQLNPTITISSNLLTAHPSGLLYTWLNCDSNYSVIPGSTGQSYTATINGDYAVIVTDNGCIDTSSCITINNVGIIENILGEELVLFPNPTSGKVSVDLGKTYDDVDIRVITIVGQVILSKHFDNTNLLSFEIEDSSGLYFVEIRTSEDASKILKVIKE
ncbi:GEVED domain-containing protein [Bacteroidota bacterium]